MVTWRKQMDFRRHTRFSTPEDIHVRVGLQSGKVPGFLVNISRGGVSIEYIPYIGALRPDRVVDVIFDDTDIVIDSLPGKTVFDIELDDKYHTPVKMRLLGIQFQPLTNKQQFELETCIKNFQGNLA